MKLFISSRVPDEIIERLAGVNYEYNDSNEPLTKKRAYRWLAGSRRPYLSPVG